MLKKERVQKILLNYHQIGLKCDEIYRLKLLISSWVLVEIKLKILTQISTINIFWSNNEFILKIFSLKFIIPKAEK